MPEDVCAICYGSEGELVSAHLEHQHLFHLECLEKALETSETLKCPLCAGEINNPAARIAIPEEYVDLFLSGSAERIRRRVKHVLYEQPWHWYNLLMMMINTRRPDAVKILLEEIGPYDEALRQSFEEHLLLCTHAESVEAMRLLLEYGASANSRGNMVLLGAIAVDSLPMVRMLVEHGVCLDTAHPLVYAKAADRPAIVQYFLSISPEMEAQYSDALLQSVQEGDHESVEDFLGEMQDVGFEMQVPLFMATIKGDLEMVRLLLDAGADPCVDDHKTLWTALKYNFFHIYKLLIASPKYKLNPVPELFLVRKLFDMIAFGADCELAFVLENHPTVDVNYGDGALFNMACRSGNKLMVGACLKRGARVTDLSYDITIEMGAKPIFVLLGAYDRDGICDKFTKSKETIKPPGDMSQAMFDAFAAFLLSFSSRVHETASVALTHAALSHDLDTFDCLLDLGADIHHENDTALSVTMEKGCLGMAAEMVKRGADATVAASRKTLKITDAIFLFLAEHAQLDRLWKMKLSTVKPSFEALRKALLVSGHKGNLANLKIILEMWRPRKLQLDDIQELLDVKFGERRDEVLELVLRHALTDC